jgi:hypothetical protein
MPFGCQEDYPKYHPKRHLVPFEQRLNHDETPGCDVAPEVLETLDERWSEQHGQAGRSLWRTAAPGLHLPLTRVHERQHLRRFVLPRQLAEPRIGNRRTYLPGRTQKAVWRMFSPMRSASYSWVRTSSTRR